MAFLYGLLAWASAGLIQRMLVGAGLTIVTFGAIQPIVTALLESVVSSLTGLPSAALQLALMSGVGEFLSITGSAVLSRVVLVFAANVAGLKLT